MPTEDLKALEHHFYDGWNKGKAALMAVIDETCTNGYVFRTTMGRETHGLTEFKQFIGNLCDSLLTAM